MSATEPIPGRTFTHDLLLHDGPDQLVDGVRAFVDQGLRSGGQVLIHGTQGRLDMVRDALGTHARLDYGLTSDLFRQPMSRLFATQRLLAESPVPVELWAVGIPAPTTDQATGTRWARFESLINEVLAPYAFHALCAYDTRTAPKRLIATGKATHPWITSQGYRTTSAEYLAPGAFHCTPWARVPGPVDMRPEVNVVLHGMKDLPRARQLVARAAATASSVPRDEVVGFITAVHEVLVNGLTHGQPPVYLTLWAQTKTLTCRVLDTGPGIPDPLAGCQHPGPSGPKGLWLARQLCGDVYVTNFPPGGSCSVLLTT